MFERRKYSIIGKGKGNSCYSSKIIIKTIFSLFVIRSKKTTSWTSRALFVYSIVLDALIKFLIIKQVLLDMSKKLV